MQSGVGHVDIIRFYPRHSEYEFILDSLPDTTNVFLERGMISETLVLQYLFVHLGTYEPLPDERSFQEIDKNIKITTFTKSLNIHHILRWSNNRRRNEIS